MTPKEKAIELFNKYFLSIPFADEMLAEERIIAKQCALIAVEEIITLFNHSPLLNNSNKGFDIIWGYWQQVKEEIEKL